MGKSAFEMTFVVVDGVWRDITSSTGKILADVLLDYNLEIDNRTQFARLYDYQIGYRIEFRAYGGQIKLNFNPIE